MTPGQTEEVIVTAANLGLGPSEAVTVDLSCADPFATVVNGSWSPGALAGRATARNDALPFKVAVKAEMPEGHLVRLTVTVKAGTMVWTQEFMFGSGGLCNPADSYRYVLITNRAIRDAQTTPNVRDLIAHKKAQGP